MATVLEVYKSLDPGFGVIFDELAQLSNDLVKLLVVDVLVMIGLLDCNLKVFRNIYCRLFVIGHILLDSHAKVFGNLHCIFFVLGQPWT